MNENKHFGLLYVLSELSKVGTFSSIGDIARKTNVESPFHQYNFSCFLR